MKFVFTLIPGVSLNVSIGYTWIPAYKRPVFTGRAARDLYYAAGGRSDPRCAILLGRRQGS
ncbi:hypothetical protein GF312_12680 [Candidatus Poribacteria bacterium]|nr:hypothetical protein [Candidatus Poribacteria bacterium]